MKFNGVELMKETASLTNAILNCGKREVKVGMGVALLMWTDRNLMQVVEIIDDRTFVAEDVVTRMEHWEDGYEYPVTDADGKWKLTGTRHTFRWNRKGRGSWRENGQKVNLSIGSTTGYRDPSF